MTPSRRSYVIKGDLVPVPPRQLGPHAAIYILLAGDTDGATLASTAADGEAAAGDSDGSRTGIFTRVRFSCCEETKNTLLVSF